MSELAFPWPEVWTPFSSHCHPEVSRIQRRSIEWGDDFQLFTRPGTRQWFDAARFGWLVSRCFHFGDEAQLQFITDLTTWIFVEDDECDHGPHGTDPAYLRARYDRFRRYLYGSLPLDRTPLDLAFHELAGRLARLAPDDAWHKRFCQTLSDYFDSSVWEAENRLHQLEPTTDRYRSMRRVTGGLPIYIDLVELAMGESLPLATRRDPRVVDLATITNDVTCWHNDIYSFAKERGAGDVHNLVYCLMREEGTDAVTAARLAANRCDAEVERFVTITEDLLFRDEVAKSEALQRYVLGLASIIQGNIDWSYQSERYRSEPPPALAVRDRDLPSLTGALSLP